MNAKVHEKDCGNDSESSGTVGGVGNRANKREIESGKVSAKKGIDSISLFYDVTQPKDCPPLLLDRRLLDRQCRTTA